MKAFMRGFRRGWVQAHLFALPCYELLFIFNEMYWMAALCLAGWLLCVHMWFDWYDGGQRGP